MGAAHLVLFFVIVFSICSSTKIGLGNVDTPVIFVDNGHLQFQVGKDKNISFQSEAVLINHIDVLTTLNKAYSATKLLDNYQASFASTVERIDTLEQRVTGLPIKTNTSDIMTIPGIYIRRVNRRINILQRKMNILLRDDCAPNPCKNGGTCLDKVDDYFCQCRDGWEGPDCLDDVNECSEFIGTDLGCQNGATCINKPGTYECVCPVGYVGIHCTRRKADCATAGRELCGQGTCIHQNNPVGYKCICDQGWTSDGPNGACVDVDECKLNHPGCSTNPLVACVNTPGSFTCGPCPLGYTGNGYHCSDIDECTHLNGGCSMNPMVTCINTQGSRICGLCPPGYSGDGESCVFRGVCNVNNGGCHEKAQCRDNPRISSTYVECICPPGYIGNGMGPNGCIPSQNPCSSNPCVNGDCTINNTSGDYICNCKRRYTGRNCDTLSDPCTPNPCRNGGMCQNISNLTFKCNCKSGFVGSLCQSEAQGCGGKVRGKNGVLKYPPGDFATYNHGISCAWTIETNSTQILNITFQKFDIENSTGCRYDWLQIHDGKNSASRSLGRFCGRQLPLGGNILTTHNVIYLWFRSDGRTAGSGFVLIWNATEPNCGGVIQATSHGSIESPGSPGEYPSNRDCYWTLKAPLGKKFHFHFFSLVIGNNSDCHHDYLEFLNNELSDEAFAKFCNTSRPAPFYSLTNEATIHFHSDAENNYPGFQMTYIVEDGIPGCGLTYTLKTGTIQPPRSSDLPKPFTCSYRIQQPINLRIKITFLSMSLYVDYCNIEYIEIYEGPDAESPLVGRYCGNNLPGLYMSSSNQLFIFTKLLGKDSDWKLKYETIGGRKLVEAGGDFEVTYNMITSSSTYIYQIERPPGYVIELDLKLTTQLLTDCMLSFVEVRDGDDEHSPLIGKYCLTSNQLITSTHNHLWIKVELGTIRYTTWQHIQRVLGVYTSTDVGCGGIIKNKIGNIASPTAPEGVYPGLLKCSWVIIAPPNNVIQITWLTFNLEDSFDCAYDNVKIFDNNTDLGMGGLMGKFCGFNLPPVILSSSNIVTIVFTTDLTIHMDGFLAAYVFILETNICGGNYFTPAGVIKSPKYPDDYPTNKECTWTITVQQGQQIMLNITDFNIENQTGCNFDYLEIRNGGTSSSPLVGRFCGTSIPKLIPSHTNQMHIFFKSDQSRRGHGFKLSWYSTATGCGGILQSPTGIIMSPNYPEPYSRNTDCTWKIIISAGSKIQVVFSDINLEKHSQCLADYVQLFDGLTINSKSLGKFCFDDTNPIVTTGNQLLVKFRSDVAVQGRGFQLHYSTVCNTTLKGWRGVIESPNFPNDYPQDQNCVWDIIVSARNKINITFSHFELERSLTTTNNSCTFDYVEIKYAKTLDDELEDPQFARQDKYCGVKNPGLITVDSDHAQIHFVTDKLLLGSGFRLEWHIFGCGGLLTHNEGTIQSPNYPRAYPPSIKCEWQIQVEYGYSIQLEFQQVDIEQVSTCEYDWVQVYNGPDNTYNLLSKICHQIKPIMLSSTGNSMFIEFQSDSSYQHKGFTANYSTILSRCGGRFTAPSGSISSPNYPKNYNKNDTCSWLIEIEETHSIVLQFVDVDLFQNCDYNYIKVYDGPTAAYPLLETVCQTGTNNTIKSTFNELYIEFRAHQIFTTKGFMAKYQKSCGSRITTEGSGTIQVYHQEFLDSINCTWTIVSTDPSRHVSLTITRMQEQIAYCDFHNVKIFNGETTDSPLLGSYCNSKIPPTLVSDGSAITILLENEIDFFATYSVFDSHCGGTFTAVDGYFATPGYPKKYTSDTQCEWTLKVAASNHITLTFIDFDIPESEKCNTDYLEIRRHNISGTLLGIYCGQNKPLNITHEGTLWMMYKSSKINADDANTITAKGFYGEFSLNEENELSGPQGIIESPLYPESYNGYSFYSWKITVGARKKILLSFKEFYMESNLDDDEDCYFTDLQVFDGVDDTAPLLKVVCGLNTPDPIKSSSNILFIVVHYNTVRMGSKFVIEWLEVSGATQPTITTPPIEGCGSNSVLDINALHNYTTFTSPGYPTGYKPHLNCEWKFSTIPMNHLAVYFKVLDIRNYFYKTCIGDYIEIYHKHSYDNDWQLIQKVCRKDPSEQYIPTADLLKITFVTDRLLNGTGFEGTILEVCGGSMSQPTGYIIFDNSTVRGFECQWNITVRSGRTIELTFEAMDISPDHADGCNNYLLIKNGKFADSPILGKGKYCGAEKPAPLKSTGNYLYLKYTGSPDIVGFKLKYQEVSIHCGGDILLTAFDRSTEISSPNYPNIPAPHTECTWIIRGPAGESLRIDFEERFDLTSQRNCEVEYVEVRDGGTVLSPLIGRFCDKAPSTQFATDNTMFIKFFTDTDDPRNGFKAKISLAYCGGTVRGKSGSIVSPSQLSTQKRNCTWHIVGPVDHYLNIWFTEFNMNFDDSISISEPNIMFKNETILETYRGTNEHPRLSTSSNEAIVNYIGHDSDKFQLKFNASQTACGGHLKQTSGTIQSPSYPVMNHLNRSCTWFIEVPEDRRVTLQVVDLDLDKTAFRHDQGVAVFDGDSYLVQLVYLLPDLPSMLAVESSSNKMKVLFWSMRPSDHRGFKATFNSDKPTICSGDFSRESGVITQPSVRNYSYWCQWKHNSNNMNLNQTLALTISQSTNLTKYTPAMCTSRTYIAVSTEDDSVISRLCHTNLQNHIVRSPFPVIQLEALANNNQMNFTVNYATHNCGGIIVGQQGYIKSPNYPNKPSDTVECVWLLKVDKEQTINLTSDGFDLGSDCEKNYLSILNGDKPRDPSIGKYCHNNKPETIISQSNSLWLEYHWDKQSTGTGFSLKYEAIGGGCGGIFHNKARTIQTPNYVKDYPNNAECLWEIRSNNGYSIQLQFIERFHLEESEDCKNDYVEIIDWKNDAWVSLGKKCGRHVPSVIESTGNKMRVLFRSNNNITGGGFKAKWNWHCGGTFEATKTPHYIVSPGYPIAYKSKLNCVYNITTKAEVLIIQFEEFELENGSSDCMYDNITIGGKYFSTSVYTRNTYCGSNKPPFLRLRGNAVITFKTDAWMNKKGFKFMYSEESCGGNITKPGTIELPAFKFKTDFRFYHLRIKCKWTITARPYQVAIIRINTLKMTLSPMCYGQSMQIYNGFDEKFENRLAVLCGELIEGQPLIAESGKMLIKLETNPLNYEGFKADIYFSDGPLVGCGGTIHLNETKYIESPNLSDLDCSWKIIAPRDYQIQVQFTVLNIPTTCSNNDSFVFCSCSFIEVRDGGGPMSDLIEKLCSSSNSVRDNYKITTSWNMGFIRFFLTGYHDNTFKATLTPVLSKCGPTLLNVTREVKVLTSPNYPNNYPPDIKCNWILNSPSLFDNFVLHFVEFDLADEADRFLDNSCSGDKIEIVQDSNRHIITEGLGPNAVYNKGKKRVYLSYNNAFAKHAFCGKKESPFDYYISERSIVLSFRSFNTQSKGKGFKLEYSITSCNRNYTAEQGRISNGNDKSECIFTITVPENNTISLYFQQLFVPFSFNCTEAGIEIRENGSISKEKELIRLCGYRVPNPVFSHTNKLYIKVYFKRTPSILKYDITYVSTDQGMGCGGEIYNYKGVLSSPLYPNEFRNDTVCRWIIKVPIGLHTVLKFNQYDLQGDCQKTYINVITYSEGSSVTHRLCKDAHPAIMRSNSRIDIEYSSSIHNGGSGWLATFQGVTRDTTDIR